MLTANRVLVTGATGFIGSNLVRRLVDEGYNVHIAVQKGSNKWSINDIMDNVKEHIVDITDFEELKKIVEEINPEVIFHLANAGVYGGKHLPEEEVIKVNFIGTVNLVNASADIDYKCFVNTGSSSEYGTKNKAMKETDICEPNNIYGITKLASTLYTSNFAKKNNKPIVNLRLFSPFGPYDNYLRLITYAIINAIKGNELNLANPNAVRDYIYIKDVIKFYINVIPLAEKLKGEIFNIGSGKETKIFYAIDKIIEFTNSKSKVNWNKIPTRDFDAPHWKADMSKSKKVFNEDIMSFDKGLKMTVEWFKKNYKLYRL